MRTLIPVKDNPDLARDAQTGMIVNINKNKHKQHLELIERKKKEKEEIQALKSDVQEIKMLLQKMLENGHNA
jgi:hypothetical protein